VNHRAALHLGARKEHELAFVINSFGFNLRHVILFCVQSNINNPVKAGEGLD
jgi:hypothetical protein